MKKQQVNNSSGQKPAKQTAVGRKSTQQGSRRKAATGKKESKSASSAQLKVIPLGGLEFQHGEVPQGEVRRNGEVDFKRPVFRFSDFLDSDGYLCLDACEIL